MSEQKRQHKEPFNKIFTTVEALNEGCAAAQAKGATYDTKKYKVSGHGKEIFVMGYSPANAASQVYEQFGIEVVSLDQAETNVNNLVNRLVNNTEKLGELSESTRKQLLELLSK